MLQWDSGQICLSALNHEASRQYVLNSALFEDVIFLFMLPNSSRPTPRGKPTVEITQYKLIGLCKCPFAAHMLSPPKASDHHDCLQQEAHLPFLMHKHVEVVPLLKGRGVGG